VKKRFFGTEDVFFTKKRKRLLSLFESFIVLQIGKECSAARGSRGCECGLWGQQYHGVVDSSLRQVVPILR